MPEIKHQVLHAESLWQPPSTVTSQLKLKPHLETVLQTQTAMKQSLWMSPSWYFSWRETEAKCGTRGKCHACLEKYSYDRESDLPKHSLDPFSVQSKSNTSLEFLVPSILLIIILILKWAPNAWGRVCLCVQVNMYVEDRTSTSEWGLSWPRAHLVS